MAARRGTRAQPTHPRDSLFTLGVDRLSAALYGTVRGRLPWRLPRLIAPSGCAEWVTVYQATT